MMIRKMLVSLAALASMGTAVAQNSQPAAVDTQAGAAISSNGPVTADYGKIQQTGGDAAEAKLATEVRHVLLMLPYYSLFDDLEYSVQGRTVTLSGNLTSEHAVTKSDAEGAVKRIEGVDKVVNNIQILPPSAFDSQVREQVYRALNRSGSLSQYFWRAAPSIHIIVDRQNVTLAGFVNNEADKDLAGMAAKGVPNVFSVTNNLRVVK